MTLGEFLQRHDNKVSMAFLPEEIPDNACPNWASIVRRQPEILQLRGSILGDVNSPKYWNWDCVGQIGIDGWCCELACVMARCNDDPCQHEG